MDVPDTGPMPPKVLDCLGQTHALIDVGGRHGVGNLLNPTPGSPVAGDQRVRDNGQMGRVFVSGR
jgi:hypothetical protein